MGNKIISRLIFHKHLYEKDYVGISHFAGIYCCSTSEKNSHYPKNSTRTAGYHHCGANTATCLFSLRIFWAFNKPCNTQKLWLRSSESLLQKEGLEIFDPANDNNISVAGYSAGKRLLVTVISIPAPNNRTSLVVNVFSDDGAINKTIGELFRQKFSGITMIDCN